MKHGAVVIDVCIDQGGCFETSRPTTHSDPTYIVDGIVHYCVTNMPGPLAVPHLCTLQRHVPTCASNRKSRVCSQRLSETRLAAAVNMVNGQITNEAVAETFGLPYKPYTGSPM